MGKARSGSKNIVAGGGVVECEVALFLAQQKKKVILVEMLSNVATEPNFMKKIKSKISEVYSIGD